MILIMFILLLLALSPLIFQQIYTAVVHTHISIPIYNPRGPAHNQVMSCSSALTLAGASVQSASFSSTRIQNGQSAHCTVVVLHTGARLYTSLPAL